MSSRISMWGSYALLRPPYFSILFHSDNFHSGNRINHIGAGACGLRHDRRQRNDRSPTHAGFTDTKFAGTIAQSESFASMLPMRRQNGSSKVIGRQPGGESSPDRVACTYASKSAVRTRTLRPTLTEGNLP